MKEQIPYFIEVPRATPSEVPVSVRVLGWSEIYGAYETGEAEAALVVGGMVAGEAAECFFIFQFAHGE